MKSEHTVSMTFIRRLEMRAFKSSGGRPVAVNFDRGFTVITGPNGSGKSNIADAILFAIGENSAKQLRAANGKLSGLIFDPKKEESGPRTGLERPGSCRVTLTFDNTDRAIPIDLDLVTVTRELKENGENTYFLNGRKTTRTTLGEILDLAGLSPGGLNIVPQGAATRVADLTPDEKRRMIEDVVGIAKFDEKKSEAQRQLSQADQRLEVALARIGEMKSTLGSLDLQRNDLIRFNLLEGQISWLRAVRTSKRIMEQKEKLDSYRGQESETNRRLQETNERRQEFENRISQVENERTRFIVDVVQGGGSSHVDMQFQLAQAENELETLQADLKDAEANTSGLEMETIPSLKQAVAVKEKEASESRSMVNQLNGELSKLDERRSDLFWWLEEFVAAEEELRETIDRKTKQLGKVQVKISDIGQRLNASELSINAVNANLSAETRRFDELKARVDGYSGILTRLETNTEKLFELYESSTKELNALDLGLGESEKRRSLLVDSIEDASRTLDKATSEVSKEEAFREVSENLAGERSGQTKLQDFCENGGVAGYVGRMNQLVHPPQTYSRATSAILGKWMTSFVVEDLHSMTALIKAAKSMKTRAFSVIPLSEVNDTPPFKIDKSSGVIGPISDLLKTEDRYRGLLNFLAGDTIVVESEAVGYILASEGVKAVTISGEVFDPGGRAFSYGYQDIILNILQGLEDIEGTSEIEEAAQSLRKAIQKRKTEVQAIEAGSRAIMKERVKKIASVASLKAEADTITRISSRYKSIFKTMAQEQERQGKVVSRLAAKLSLFTERRESLRRALNSLNDLIENTRSLQLDEMLRELESYRKSLEGEADFLRNRIAEVNLNYTREKANLENVLQRTLEENQLDLESALEEFKQSKEFVRDAPKRLKELSEAKSGLDERIEKLKESSRRSQPVLDEFEGKIRRLKEERDSTARSVSNLERELFSIRAAISSVEEKIEETLGSLRMLGYSDLLEVFDSSEHLLSELERESETVATSVNRGAERQYGEMYQNYKSLSVRHNELEKERNSIIGFIESVESEKKQVFMTAFAKIREEFGFVFKRLTEGEAWLELEDEEEVFSGGLLLMARFGLKQPWESLSLSGGEKAVSGVALILAMQSVQSHPFYLFDEIDSHLDAINSGNLAQFLRERSSGAQIVAITLRDVIVSRSDLTYGLYATGGISRFVQYKPAAEVQVTRG